MRVLVEDYDKKATYSVVNFQKLKQELFSDINIFCRNYNRLREDLHVLRLGVGQERDTESLDNYGSALKQYYNNGKVDNVGVEYRIEVTRFDIVMIVTVIIKRTDITVRNFIFRYRKSAGTQGELSNPDYSPTSNKQTK